MKKFQRLPEPEFLATTWIEWGEEWERRHTENPKAKFNWRQIENTPVNHLLLPQLKAQTQDHCSFCDNFPNDADTIEHFKPKSLFHRDAYRWTNLYYCCVRCQEKSDEFDDLLLQPDAIEYEFDRYFYWDFTRGEIKINTQASSQDQLRADVTIRLYRLNIKHPTLRQLEAKKWSECKGKMSVNDFAYRHFIAY